MPRNDELLEDVMQLCLLIDDFVEFLNLRAVLKELEGTLAVILVDDCARNGDVFENSLDVLCLVAANSRYLFADGCTRLINLPLVTRYGLLPHAFEVAHFESILLLVELHCLSHVDFLSFVEAQLIRKRITGLEFFGYF